MQLAVMYVYYVVELKLNIQLYYATKSLLMGKLNICSTYCILEPPPKKVREEILYFFSPDYNAILRG